MKSKDTLTVVLQSRHACSSVCVYVQYIIMYTLVFAYLPVYTVYSFREVDFFRRIHNIPYSNPEVYALSLCL